MTLLYLATVTEEDFSRFNIVGTSQQPAKTRALSGLDSDLLGDAQIGTYSAISGALKTNRGRGPFVSPEHRNECLDFLGQVDFSRLYSLYFTRHGAAQQFHELLFRLWEVCAA